MFDFEERISAHTCIGNDAIQLIPGEIIRENVRFDLLLRACTTFGRLPVHGADTIPLPGSNVRSFFLKAGMTIRFRM
jgi:hypothetical protein